MIVPFYAKSAASLIALGADELVVCRSGELGSIDPQVRDVVSNTFVPAHSIKEAINFIEETKDSHVKLSLTDKISPLLVGAYREAAKSSKQYLDETLSKLGEKKDEAIYTFTERFLSHGYPVDRELLKQIGINVSEPDIDTENTLCDLHEIYGDIAETLYANHVDQVGELLVIQTSYAHAVIFGNDDVTSRTMDAQLLQDVKDKALASMAPPEGKVTHV